MKDGPSSPLFKPIILRRGMPISRLAKSPVPPDMAKASEFAPRGSCVSWGIPFDIDKAVVVGAKPVTIKLAPMKARWIIVLHTCSFALPGPGEKSRNDGSGPGWPGEHVANYSFVYEDGSTHRVAIRRRFQIGAFRKNWGDTCFEAVAHQKPHSVRPPHEQLRPYWGHAQTRVEAGDSVPWINWLWAWENPFPSKRVVGLTCEAINGPVVLSAVSAGNTSTHPLRWQRRRKAILRLGRGVKFDPTLDKTGLVSHIQLDLGQVISTKPRPIYPDRDWSRSYNNQLPELSERELVVEYTSHPEAAFHLPGKRIVRVSKVEAGTGRGNISVVPPADTAVKVRVVQKGSIRPVPVKLHIHGSAGEYLAPVDRHRIPNAAWFEDYSVDFSHRGVHYCTYIDGETVVNLPAGRVFVEVSKGFEIAPVRKTERVTPTTREIVIEIDKVLPWRARGWISADTHVHFLSPHSALLEGSAEGVNIVNLLASQWGELMTNVGDFEGKTTLGSKEAGGDGEYLVRVGTENRQHVLGHISLLGYSGRIIAPMTTGGPDEAALGDPIGTTLTLWAQQCRKQGGVVVIPHFPNPRAEHAATIVSAKADAVEMTCWGNLYAGIDPYSLMDWYRYLNCGYLVAAVGGTDKMSADTAVGTVRTYANVGPGRQFTYEAWKKAIRRAETFVTYGPLMEFSVDGRPCGGRIAMSATGGTVDVAWNAASVTIPMSKVELIVNGEVRESRAVDSHRDQGHWRVKLGRSSWLALLVRGHYPDKPEIVAAHSSPVMVEVAGTQFFSAADAITILEQIEGALAYLDTIGTKAETSAYRRMRLSMVSAHRALHNRMHAGGCFHHHTPKDDHHR